MTWEELGIDVSKMRGSQNKTRCPRCSDDRKNKRDPSLSVNLTEKTWNCHHCQWHGKLMDKSEFKQKEKDYVKPVFTNVTSLTPEIVDWFKKRGISQQTLIDSKITCGEEFMPQTKQKEPVIKFNYFRGDELINTKFRTF